jgi:hypothetical protein
MDGGSVLWLRWPCLPLVSQGGQDASEGPGQSPPAKVRWRVLDATVQQHEATCTVCGTSFEPRQSGVPRKFCGKTCRTRHHNAKHRRKGNGANPAGLPIARWRRPEELTFSVARIEKPRRKLAGDEASPLQPWTESLHRWLT